MRMGLMGLIGVLGTVAALAGTITAAVDGGATLLASVPLAGMLAAAIPGQIAITVALIGTTAAFSVFMSGLLYQNTLPALAHFFHFACDAFGVPRRVEKQTCSVSFGKGRGKKTFPLPEVETPRKSIVCELGTLGLWKSTPAMSAMQKVLDHG
jgi:small ligand-binding sensory domain FIST